MASVAAEASACAIKKHWAIKLIILNSTGDNHVQQLLIDVEQLINLTDQLLCDFSIALLLAHQLTKLFVVQGYHISD